MGYPNFLFNALWNLHDLTNVAYRRDFPEIIVPTAANAGAATAGNTDVLGAFAQIIAATPQDLTILGATLGFTTGVTTAAGAAVLALLPRILRAQLGFGAGNTRYAEFRSGNEAFVQILNPGINTIVTINASQGNHHLIGPIKIPAGTRLSYAVAFHDNAVNFPNVLTRCYLTAFPNGLVVKTLAKNIKDLLSGNVATDTVTTDYVGVARAAAVWTFGAWITLPIKGAGVADRDYLVYDFHYGEWAGTIVNNQFDLGIGIAGSEVVQARVPDPGVAGATFNSTRNQFCLPFILHAGERLAARVMGASGAIDTAQVSATMMAL